MCRAFFGSLLLLFIVGCVDSASSSADDAQPPDPEPEECGAPAPQSVPLPRTADAAAVRLEEWFTCLGYAEVEAMCPDMRSEWTHVGQRRSDGSTLIGRRFMRCRVDFDGRFEVFEYEMAPHILPPLPEERPVEPRCYHTDTPEGRRFNGECRQQSLRQSGGEVGYPDIGTAEAAVERLTERHECSGCAVEEYQFDCWGPVEMTQGFLATACRIYDRVNFGTSYLFYDFALYDRF